MLDSKILYGAYDLLPSGIVVFSLDKEIQLIYGNKYYYDKFSDGKKDTLNIDENDAEVLKTAVQSINDNNSVKAEYSFNINGEKHRAQMVISQCENGYIGAVSDVTDSYNMKQKIEIDSDLKVYNRNAAVSRINDYLAKHRNDNRFALLVLDIDDFKSINDNYGHLYGDTVIAMVAKKLRELAEDCGIVGRYGGDEFFVFLEDMSYDEITETSTKILNGIASLQFVDERQITCSIGIAIGEMFDGVPEYKNLFERADKALYNVKENGKAHWRVYDEATMGGNKSGHAIDYENDESDADEELLKSRDLMKVFMELSSGARTSDAATYRIIHYVAEKFGIDWLQIMQVDCKEDLITIKYEWCSDKNFQNNSGRSGYYAHSDIMRFRNHFEKNPVFLICPEITEGFSPKFQREFEKNMKHSVIYNASVTSDDVFFMFVCTRFDKAKAWTEEEALGLSSATKLMTMYVSQANRETENERRYKKLVEYEKKTGLYTMQKFYEQLGRLRKVAAERGDDVAIVHTDFKQFIKFNRKFGLEAGDDVIKAFAEFIQGNEDPECNIRAHIDATDIFIAGKRIPKGDLGIAERVDNINKAFCEEQNKKYPGANLMLKTGIYILKDGDTGGDAIDFAVLAKDAVKDADTSYCVMYEE